MLKVLKRDSSFEYPQHMIWLRNKKKNVRQSGRKQNTALPLKPVLGGMRIVALSISSHEQAQ